MEDDLDLIPSKEKTRSAFKKPVKTKSVSSYRTDRVKSSIPKA